MLSHVAVILGFICALLATILLYIFVLPNRKNGKLPRFFQFLRDVLTFKKLYLELILRTLYIFSTCICIFWGFFLLFSREEYYSYGVFGGSYSESTFVEGLIILILGPILLRIVYEFAMLLILAVKNLMEINHKMTPPPPATAELEPEPESVSEPHYLYCTQCGTRYDANEGNCPNCGLE